MAAQCSNKSDPPIAVIFDMDGVLVDSAAPHFQSWQRLAEECGGTVTDEQFAETFGRQNRDIIPRLFGTVSDDRLRALADRKEEIYRDLVRENPPIVAGAVNLVRDLYASGVRLAVGSSGPRENIELILDGMRVRDCFAAVISSDDVTRGKPDPQVFVLAIDRLGVPPSRCVVVEDAPVGIAAAKAAEARAVAVLLHHSSDAFADADLRVQCLADLSAERLISLARS